MRPATAILVVAGLRYRLDLVRVRRALVEFAMRSREPNFEQVAARAGIGRTTLWRFLSGRQVSPRTVTAVLRVLGLRWDEVASPL